MVAALPDCPSPVPSTHGDGLQPPVTLALESLASSSCPGGHLHSCGTPTETHIHISKHLKTFEHSLSEVVFAFSRMTSELM